MISSDFKLACAVDTLNSQGTRMGTFSIQHHYLGFWLVRNPNVHQMIHAPKLEMHTFSTIVLASGPCTIPMYTDVSMCTN